tara:strand:+ start:5 stop:2116 length:2112 start_codon:yes stop_codon:yes gene_type:complete
MAMKTLSDNRATILSRMFNINTPLTEIDVEELMSDPVVAERMNVYEQFLSGKPFQAAKGGFIFSPDELSDPQVKEEMKDNPEFSEFSVDQQAATANKMQQRFPLPQNNRNVRGFQTGGATTSAVTELVAPDPVEVERIRKQQEALQKLATDQATTISNVYGDPSKVITPATVAPIASGADQTIAAGTGAVSGAAPSVATPTSTTTSQVTTPVAQTPQGIMTAATAAPEVKTATDAMTAAQGTVSTGAQAVGQTATTTAVSDLNAAQGTATLMNNPVQRSIQTGELVSGAANAATASAFSEQVQAATATPSAQATVQGQLNTLMDDFEGGATPSWAAGAMRAATAAMAQRGLGASSMAGQAIVQAAMEAALPIAQADAQIVAQFETQNLSNRQQRAMLAAQQRATFMGMEFDQAFQARVQNSARIGDIANMNFTADQQVALENSRAVNTMNISNLNNRQANVMAEAAALSQLDMTNLSNRQQAAVMNAQNFMQMDMQNLSNEQQTGMFTQQSVLQSLFTDQAAINAANQFNATSENQTQQFFQSLASQANQFNSTQTNAMAQFDAENLSTLQRFNAELENQRDQFNAQNALVIAQANAQWRQSVSTADTAAQNAANLEFARTINGLTGNAIDQIWQRERDLMSFAFTASESAADRAVNIAIQKLSGEQKAELYDNIGKGKLFGNLLMGVLGKATGINYLTGGSV